MKASELAEMMNRDADLISRHLLPNGRRDGREWRVGSTDGEEGQSLGICIEGNKQGVWCEFNGERGGDILDLWMEVKGVGLSEAMSQAMLFLGIEDERERIFKPKKQYKPPVKPKCKTVIPASAVFKYLSAERKLEPKTIERFKIADGGDKIVFPFIRDGEPVMIKTLALERKNGKKEIKLTSADQEPCLFGWQAIDPKARKVIIAEGELDAMSLNQMGFNALSLPFGAGKQSQTWIETEYDRVNQFDEIYLCMDDDEAGEQGRNEIIERLGRHRCKVLKLTGYKDANEALQKGYDIFDLQGDMDKAKTLDPDELKQLAEFHEQIMDEFYPKNDAQLGIKLPWEKTHNLVRIRPGEISVWAGINSHGKSVLLSNVMVDCVAQGDRVCIASMEMAPKDTGMKMYQQIGNVSCPAPDYAAKIRDFITDGVWIFNLYGTAKSDRILQVFEYAKNRYGIKHFVVDSLAKCGIREDDYNKQKDFIDKLMEFAGKFNVHVHVVMHMRKQDNEKGMPGKMDLKGTGALSDMIHNLFVVYRNKNKESALSGTDPLKIKKYKDKGDAYLSIEKQRKTGKEPTFALWFHEGSCQFLGSATEPPKRYIY